MVDEDDDADEDDDNDDICAQSTTQTTEAGDDDAVQTAVAYGNDCVCIDGGQDVLVNDDNDDSISILEFS